MSSSPPTLDLHGLRHDQVEHQVHQFLHDNRETMPCKIIVGMSDAMLRLVHNVLDEMKLFSHIERFQNPGCLVVYEKKWWD